ncbi:MAG: recombinase RmuC [Ferruginibacter sp.]|nr:recombinase RmuC [Ferruginibacter sp.]
MNVSVIYLVAGIVLASITCWLIFRNLLQQKLALTNERLAQQTEAFLKLQQNHAALQSDKEAIFSRMLTAESRMGFYEEQSAKHESLLAEQLQTQKDLAAAGAALLHSEQKLLQQKEELEKIGEKFRFEFRNLAQAIMEEKSEKFTQVNEQKMNELLNPLKTQLVDFKQKVEDTYDKESKERFSLSKEVERLINMTQQVSLEANNLTTALKGNNKMQGHWGEMILGSLLENAGLTLNREYFLQEFIRDSAGNTIKDEHGKGLQPDAMIVYPDGRKVIVDSKVSLIAWDASCAEADTAEQKRYLLEHIRSMRQHIDGLSRKNYPRYAAALDYVLLFVPIEPAFLEALKTDPQLWKYAYERNILLVSPTNLFVVLKIVADLWKVELQNRNAVEIADKAGALYDKFAGFMENFELAGKKIADAGNAFDAAQKQLSTGRGNISTRVEELKKMGANASKQLPERLLGDAE